MFEKLWSLWQLNYITADSLKKWVKLNKINSKLGITEEEFKIITGLDYE